MGGSDKHVEVEFIGGSRLGSIRGGLLHDWRVSEVRLDDLHVQTLLLTLERDSTEGAAVTLAVRLDLRDVLKHLAWDITDKAALVLK